MKKNTLIATAAVVALGASVATTTTTASAKTSYKVKSGKLINEKTGKVIKGYKTFKTDLYKNGKKFTGVYKSKYYKNGKLGTGTFKNIKYKKGEKFTGISTDKKYYKNGKLGTGTYKNIKYKNGVKFTGISTDKKFYKNGKLGTGTYENVKYKNGVLFNGISSNGAQYTNGILTATKAEVALSTAQAEAEAAQAELQQAQQQLADLSAIEAQLNGGVVPVATLKRVYTLSNDELSKFIQENKGLDFSKLTADQKAAISDKLNAHKKEATERVQKAAEQVVVAFKKAVEAAATVAKEAKNEAQAKKAQEALKATQTAVAAIATVVNNIPGVKVDTSELEKTLAEAEKALSENPNAPADNNTGDQGTTPKPVDPTPSTPTDNNTNTGNTGSTTPTPVNPTPTTPTDNTKPVDPQKPGTEDNKKVQVTSVSAVNGTITVTLKETVETVKPSDFTVTQGINKNEATAVTVTKAELADDKKTVTLTVASVVATDAEQSVVYTVNTVVAEAFTVAAKETEKVKTGAEAEAAKIKTNAVTVEKGATDDDINKAFAAEAQKEVDEDYTVTAVYEANKVTEASEGENAEESDVKEESPVAPVSAEDEVNEETDAPATEEGSEVEATTATGKVTYTVTKGEGEAKEEATVTIDATVTYEDKTPEPEDKVEVTAVSVINDITVENGVDPVLPTTVSGTTTGEPVNLNVTWTIPEGFDNTKVGDYTFTGTVTAPQGYALATDVSDEVTVKVTVKEAPDTENPVITTEAADAEIEVSALASFTAPTATATDNVDANVEVAVAYKIGDKEAKLDEVKALTAGSTFTVVFTATDAAGNEATAKTVTYTVVADKDKTAPTVKEVTVKGKTVTVSFTEEVAYLDGEKVKELADGAEAKDFFKLVGSDSQEVTGAIVSAKYDAANKTYVITLADSVADSAYKLTYEAPTNYALVDLAGNKLETVSETVKIDTTAPTVQSATYKVGETTKEATVANGKITFAVGQDTNTSEIKLTLSEAVTVPKGTKIVVKDGDAVLDSNYGTITVNNNIITITPTHGTAALAGTFTVEVQLPTGEKITDEAGNELTIPALELNVTSTEELETARLIEAYGKVPLKVVNETTVKTVNTYYADETKKTAVVEALKVFDAALTAATNKQLTKDQLIALANKVAKVDAETDLAKAITDANAEAVATKVNAASVTNATGFITVLTTAVGEVQAEANAQAALDEAAQAGVALNTKGTTAVEKLASVQQVTKEGLTSDSKLLVVTLVNEKNSQIASTLDNVKVHLESTKQVAINTGNIVLEDKQIKIKGPLVTPDDFKKLKANPESKEAYRITVLNGSNKNQKLVKIAILPSGQAVIEDVTYANLVKAQAAVAALENKTPFELATTDVIEKAETAVATVSNTTEKNELTNKINTAKQKIAAAQTAGTLLNLTTKTADKSFLTLLVKEGSNQVKATPEAINKALQARYDAIATGELSTVTEYDKEGIAALDKDKAVINFDAIKVSEDGQWIAVEGDFMTTEAFKVAKGKGAYVNETYNITILVKDAPATPGSESQYKAAKIVVTADDNGNVSSTTLAEVN